MHFSTGTPAVYKETPKPDGRLSPVFKSIKNQWMVVDVSELEVAMAMRMDACVRPFRIGNTGPTFKAFWKKFLVAGTLHKWDTNEKLLANLPLFLEDCMGLSCFGRTV